MVAPQFQSFLVQRAVETTCVIGIAVSLDGVHQEM